MNMIGSYNKVSESKIPVKPLLTSAVREICALRSVGAGGGGDRPRPPGGNQQWLSRLDLPTRLRGGGHSGQVFNAIPDLRPGLVTTF
jgi:hypothetical protein